MGPLLDSGANSRAAGVLNVEYGVCVFPTAAAFAGAAADANVASLFVLPGAAVRPAARGVDEVAFWSNFFILSRTLVLLVVGFTGTSPGRSSMGEETERADGRKP